MAVEIVKAFCEKHGLEYEAKSINIFGVISKCPKCKDEEEKEKEQEALRQAELQKKQDYEDMINYLEKFSNIPKRYIMRNANLEFDNFKRHCDILKNKLEKNIFLIGDPGTGKTFFIDEVQMLCTNEKIHILEALVCGAYSNGSVIILCGNGIKEDYHFLSNPKYKRMTSRLKDGGMDLIDFGSGDLRI